MPDLISTLNNAGYWKQNNALKLENDNETIAVDQRQKAEGSKALDSRTFYDTGKVKDAGRQNEAIRQKVKAVLQSLSGPSEQEGVIRKDLKQAICRKLHIVDGGANQADTDVYKPLSVRTAKELVAKAYGAYAETVFMKEHAARQAAVFKRFEEVKVRALLAEKTPSLDKLFASFGTALAKAGAGLKQAEETAAKETAENGEVSAKTQALMKKAMAKVAAAYESFDSGLGKLERKLPDIRQLTDKVLADYAKASKVKLGDIVKARLQDQAPKLFKIGMNATVLKTEIKAALETLVRTEFAGERQSALPGDGTAAVSLPQDFTVDLTAVKAKLDKDFEAVKARRQRGEILTEPKTFSVDAKSWKGVFQFRGGLSLTDDFAATTRKYRMLLADCWGADSCLKIGRERRKVGVLSAVESICNGKELQHLGVLRALQVRPDLLVCKVADELGVDGALEGCEYELERNSNGDILVTASTRDESTVTAAVTICVHADGTCEEQGRPVISSNDQLADQREIGARRQALAERLPDLQQLCKDTKDQIEAKLAYSAKKLGFAEAKQAIRESAFVFVDEQFKLVQDLVSGKEPMPGLESSVAAGAYEEKLRANLKAKEDQILSFDAANLSLVRGLAEQLAKVKDGLDAIRTELGKSLKDDLGDFYRNALGDMEGLLEQYWTNLEAGFACSESNGEDAKNEVLSCVEKYVNRLLAAMKDVRAVFPKQPGARTDLTNLNAAFAKLQDVPRPSFAFEKFTREAKLRMTDHLKLLAVDFKLACPNLSRSAMKTVETFVDAVNVMVEKAKGWKDEAVRKDFFDLAMEKRNRLMNAFNAASAKGVNLDRGLGSLLATEYDELRKTFETVASHEALADLEGVLDRQLEAVQELVKNPARTGRIRWSGLQMDVLDRMHGLLAEVKSELDYLNQCVGKDGRKPPTPEQVLALKVRLADCCRAFFKGDIDKKQLRPGFLDKESNYLSEAVVKELQELDKDIFRLTEVADNAPSTGSPFAATNGDIKSFEELERLTKATAILSGTKLNVDNDELQEQATSILLALDNCPASYRQIDLNGNFLGLTEKGEAVVRETLLAVIDAETIKLADRLDGKEEAFEVGGFLTDGEWNEIRAALKERFETVIATEGEVASEVDEDVRQDDGLLPGEVLRRGDGIFGLDVSSLDAKQKESLLDIIATSFASRSERMKYQSQKEEIGNQWLLRTADRGFAETFHKDVFKQALFSGDLPLDGSMTSAGLTFLAKMVERGDSSCPRFFGSMWSGSGFHTTSVGEIFRILQGNGITQQALQEYYTGRNWPSAVNKNKRTGEERPIENNLTDIVDGRGSVVSNHLATVLSMLFEINGSRGLGLDNLCVRVFGKNILEVTPQDVDDFNEKHRSFFVEGEVNFQALDPALGLSGEIREVYGLVSGDVLFNQGNAPLAKRLYDAFAQVAATNEAKTLAVKGASVKIVPREGGFFALELTIRQENGTDRTVKAPMGIALAAFSGRMADAFLANPALVDRQFLQTLLPARNVPRTTSRDRQLAMTFVAAATGLQATTLSNVPTDTVVEIAHLLSSSQALSNQAENRKVAEQMIAAAETERQAVLFNGVDTLELYERMEAAPPGEVEKAVYVPNDRGPRAGETLAAAQKRQLHEFVAELVLPDDTTKFDLDSAKKGLGEGAILRQTLLSHRFEVALLIGHPELLDDFSLAGKAADGKQDAVKEALARFAVGLKAQVVEAGGLKKFFRQLQNEVGDSKAEFDQALSGLVSPLHQAADVLLEDLQDRLTQSMKAAFEKTTAALGNQPFWKKTIDQMSGGTLDVNSGYGRFLMDSMARYFTSMESIDRRRMASSVLRTASAGSTQSDMLAAMIKGAGPVFQKLMQGLPETALPDELREVVKDLKSNLPPIPAEMVRATLFDMVRQSHGAITRIELRKSLGAATVGQAFKCTIYTKNKPNGEDCVLKVLRPDAQNRARREFDLFLKTANETPGMQGSFEARLRSIFDELDFTIEATNVKRGAIYNSGVVKDGIKGVRSMELHPDISPTVNAMVVREAPGITYDRYTRDLTKRVDEELNDRDFTVVEKGGDVWYENSNAFTVLQKHQKLDALYQDALARQKNLISFSEKWFYESIFGDGFTHMDVHSGNLMCDKDTLTVIDYGNAATLSANDRRNVKWALAWLGVRNLDGFLGYFKNMLPPTAVKIFSESARQRAIRQDLEDLFARFDTTDSGRAFSAALHVIEQHGVPLPSGLFGLMQSLQRLDGSIRLINEQLDRIRTAQSKLKLVVDHATDPSALPTIFDFFQNFHVGIGSDRKPLNYPGREQEYSKERLGLIMDGVGKGSLSKELWDGYFGDSNTVFMNELRKGFAQQPDGKYLAGSWCATVMDEMDKAFAGKANRLDEMLSALKRDCTKVFADSIEVNLQRSGVLERLKNLPELTPQNREQYEAAMREIFMRVDAMLVIFCNTQIAHRLYDDDNGGRTFNDRFVDFDDAFEGFGSAIGRGAMSFLKELTGSAGSIVKTVFFDSPVKLKQNLESRTEQELKAVNRRNKLFGKLAPYEKFIEQNSLSLFETGRVRRVMKEFRYPSGLPERVHKHGLNDAETNRLLVETLQFNIRNIEEDLTKAGLASRFKQDSASRPALVKYAMLRMSINHPEFYLGLGKADDATIDRVSGGDEDVKAALTILREVGREPPADGLTREQKKQIGGLF